MKARLVRSEEPLGSVLRDAIAQANACLFAVAYIDQLAAEQLAPVVAARLASSSAFVFRLLVRTSDYYTSPDALRTFHQLVMSAPGRVRLRESTHTKFHAKCFGFRTGPQHPTVIIGSANLMAGALDTESGELGVVVAGGQLAVDAWRALESFWREGAEITSKSLADYDRRHKALASRRAELAAALAALPQPARHSDLSAPERIPPRLFVKASPLMDDAEQSEIEACARADGVSVPPFYFAFESEREASRLPRDYPFLDFEFMAEDHDQLESVSLVRVGDSIDIRGDLWGAPKWLLPYPTVRGSTLDFDNIRRFRFRKALERAGLLDWHETTPTGYIGRRRLPLLRALADLGWKEAIAALAAEGEGRNT